MPAVAKTYQYYPVVPLSDLSDLFSVGNNRLVGKKVCIISHLPKVLRIGAKLPIANKYVLFVEGTDQVDSIQWSVKLYFRGELLDNPAGLQTYNADTNEFLLSIDAAYYSAAGNKLFDRMVIGCLVTKGAEAARLEVEHSLVDMLDVVDLVQENAFALAGDASRRLYISNPDTTNYLLNCLNDYVTEENLTWNGVPILANAAERENLLTTVIAIIYQHVLNDSSSEFTFSVDVDSFDNKNLKAHLNVVPEPTYDGGFRNGICRLPLDALNDAFANLGQVPDFANIPDANPLYAILAGVPNTVLPDGASDFDDAVPELMPPTIKAAKQRLYGNKARLIELYNLTSFPKSTVKLAIMLLKFFFECSRKNQCKECLRKQAAWPAMGFHQIHTQPDFWKNTLTHYLGGPSSQIKAFSGHVDSAFRLISSQQVYLILHNAPRIVTAYFARKVVKATGVGLSCSFERLDSRAVRVGNDGRGLALQPDFDLVLGRQVYLVIETLNCRGKELICAVRSSGLSGNANNLDVVLGPETWDPEPIIAVRQQISVVVGRHAALNHSAGEHADYVNVFSDPAQGSYNVDHLDKAIVKLQLRPTNQAAFDAWATRLAAGTANVEVSAGLVANPGTHYGNSPALIDTPGAFLGAADPFDAAARFRVINRIVYEVFHPENRRSSLSMNGGNRRRVGKTVNNFVASIADTDAVNLPRRTVDFYYHDQNDNEHHLCTCALFRPPRRANGQVVAGNSNPANVPVGFTSDGPAPAGGDAYWNYYYPDGSIVTRDNPAAAGTDYGIRRYPLGPGGVADVVDLVRMPDNLNVILSVSAAHTVTVTFAFAGTQRRYANPGCFAAFLGILAQLNYPDVQSTGMCFQDATSFPSVSHPNGDSIDTRYLNDVPGAQPYIKRHAIIAAFREWGFSQVISGTAAMHTVPDDGADVHNAQHNDHLHAGNYLDANIHVITG